MRDPRWWQSAVFVTVLVTFDVHAQATPFWPLTVEGLMEVEVFTHRTHHRVDGHSHLTDLSIDKIEAAIEAPLVANTSVRVTVETEKIGSEEEELEPLYLKELILSKRLEDKHTVFAGRMELPFGVFKSFAISDPQTKKVGKSKTDAGLGIKGRYVPAHLAWNVVVFGDDYRTSEAGADGATLNVVFQSATGWSVGTGYISHQYAERQAPSLVNVHFRYLGSRWSLFGEYVGALDNRGGEEPHALSLEAVIELADRLKSGARVQTVTRRLNASGARNVYDEIAAIVKYQVHPVITLGLEYLSAKTHDGDGVVERARRLTAQTVLSF